MTSSHEASGRQRAFWTGDRVAGLMLIGIAALVAVETRVLPLGSLGNPGPGYAPLLFAAILAGLGVVVALRPGGLALGEMRWGEAKHAAVILASVAFAAVAIERLGFRLTMLAILVFLLGAVERRRPFAVATVSLALSFGAYFLFWNILRVPLPTGPFGL